MKFYGCLTNRLEEGKQFVDEIKVGTGVTEYHYSDRKPFEVIDVINQKHIIIRALDYIRIDNNGMSDAQTYEYISNEKNAKYELVLRNNVWYKVIEVNKENWLKRAEQLVQENSFRKIESAYNYIRCMSGLTEKQYQNVDAGKSVKKYIKMNISIGYADMFYDYTF
jgi:hypothetical protein